MSRVIFFLASLFLIWNQLNGQDTASNKLKLNQSLYFEGYYGYDFNKPQNHIRQNFFFNHNRHNTFGVNIALLNLEASNELVRVKLGIQAGTYAQDNYSAEAPMLRTLNEAYGGVALCKDRSLWLDVGLFASHMGFESSVGADNVTLTRSFSAENSPYFLTGARLQYTASEKLSVLAVVSNGWQRIQRVNASNFPGFGTQLVYSPNDKLSFNWSTFVCSETSDSAKQLRLFNDFYMIGSWSEKQQTIVGFDIGFQQATAFSSNYNRWSVLSILHKLTLTEKCALGFRYEWFDDANQLIIGSTNVSETSIHGASVNYDRTITKGVLWRSELRYLTANNDFYAVDDASQWRSNNLTFMTSLCVKLN